MKIIVSHDVDHLTVSEHFKDLIIPKFIIRFNIELMLGKISVKEALLRTNNLFKNKWNNIKELIDFDKTNRVRSTFFVGINNGVGLNYKIDYSKQYILEILEKGFDCGVHGISYKSQEEVNYEYNLFREISGLKSFGIRMHYLRNNTETLKYLSEAGYLFDTTDFRTKDLYKIDKMYEFPLHIMEKYEIEGNKKWQIKTKKEAIESSIKKIEEAKNFNIKYLTILFHDFYFDDSFLTWKNWYIDIINYCINEGYEFISYKDAINETNNF